MVGRVLFESSRLNPDGNIVGVEADTGVGDEPHYNGDITSPGQVQVYEPTWATWRIGKPTHSCGQPAT